MPSTNPKADALLTDLWQSLRAHDRERIVLAILEAVQADLTLEELYSDVLEPFLAGVGGAWQQGSTSVWEEHLASDAVGAAVSALYPHVLERKARLLSVPVTVAFFCPPEEAHDLGLRMLADRFDLRGFRTVYVGAFTPVDQMVACARQTGADVLCLSASTHFHRASLPAVVQRLERELPGRRIVVGGPAFAFSGQGWERYRPLSVEALMDELTEAAAASTGEA